MNNAELQLALFFNSDPRKHPTDAQRKKRRWEYGFQKWSDKQALSGLTHYGACGYGAICDYCDGNPKGRVCVRAMNEMLRTKRLSIDYESLTYEQAFDGAFGNDNTP